jgi:6-pyruvoyltetrahydropterin/6-carboxytetrahydropterin synthase
LKLTRRYRFSASHRLHSPALSDDENRALYGKCNNPYGHGHDYAVDITVEGTPDASGQVVNRTALDTLMRDQVLARVDHRDLNSDIPELGGRVPTTENLAAVIQQFLSQNWKLDARLVQVRISETERNTFGWEAAKP